MEMNKCNKKQLKIVLFLVFMSVSFNIRLIYLSQLLHASIIRVHVLLENLHRKYIFAFLRFWSFWSCTFLNLNEGCNFYFLFYCIYTQLWNVYSQKIYIKLLSFFDQIEKLVFLEVKTLENSLQINIFLFFFNIYKC